MEQEMRINIVDSFMIAGCPLDSTFATTSTSALAPRPILEGECETYDVVMYHHFGASGRGLHTTFTRCEESQPQLRSCMFSSTLGVPLICPSYVLHTKKLINAQSSCISLERLTSAKRQCLSVLSRKTRLSHSTSVPCEVVHSVRGCERANASAQSS